MTPETIGRVSQAKMDALCAKNIHTSRLGSLKKKLWCVDVLSLVIPIIGFGILALTKDATRPMIATSASVASICLLVLAAIKRVGQWEEETRRHTRHITENLLLKEESAALLADQNADDGRGLAFLRLAEGIERADAQQLGVVSQKEQQTAFREALKEIDPSNPSPACPGCGANPWHYMRGTCQMCGNTPAMRKS